MLLLATTDPAGGHPLAAAGRGSLRGRQMTVARPFPLPSDMRAANILARAGAAHLRAFITGNTPEREARAMFGDGTIIKAATAPATLTTPGWAKDLGGVAIYDLIQSAT